MRVLNSRCWLVLAAVACLAGCGRQERIEAVQFAKVLKGKKANFTNANTLENNFITSARAFCEGITGNGAGHGAELDQSAALATELAKAPAAVSSELSQVRQAIDGQTLEEDYTRHVRNVLTTSLTKRQRSLQDMRALLEQAAPQFVEYKHSKDYKGDTYPDGVGKLNDLLRAYAPPEDSLGAALADLQTKYDIKDSEL